MGRGGQTMTSDKNSAPALTVKDVSYAYGQKHALDHVSFSVETGHCTILLGPNGAGKTTLFSLITGLFDCPEGSIHIAGNSLRHNTSKALAELGTVFQQPTLDLDLSIRQNLQYHAALYGMGKKAASLRIDAELERQNILERSEEKVRQLNGGHRRRVEIARALLHKPRLLLLDEPTVGLDVPSRSSIVNHVHQLAASGEIAVLWTTHLIDEIQPNDQLIIIDAGTIKARGSIDAIQADTETDSIGAAFSVLTRRGGPT
jgi:ABC-2 type transport system ATP-binding protein